MEVVATPPWDRAFGELVRPGVTERLHDHVEVFQPEDRRHRVVQLRRSASNIEPNSWYDRTGRYAANGWSHPSASIGRSVRCGARTTVRAAARSLSASRRRCGRTGPGSPSIDGSAVIWRAPVLCRLRQPCCHCVGRSCHRRLAPVSCISAASANDDVPDRCVRPAASTRDRASAATCAARRSRNPSTVRSPRWTPAARPVPRARQSALDLLR